MSEKEEKTVEIRERASVQKAARNRAEFAEFMEKSTPSPTLASRRAEFEDLIEAVRPELHRYVARMVGSAIDGEDVVQEAIVKAYYSLPLETAESNLRGWLFRIAHNKAIDFLRRANLKTMAQIDEQFPAVEPERPLEQKELAAIALSVFLKLAPRQRSCVILKDVLDYSLAEISEFLNASVPEIKALLHRGRTRLRELGKNTETVKPVLDERKQKLLSDYINRFNARDFEGVRAMLADEVRLDLINKTKLNGRAEVAGNYFNNYQRLEDWRFNLGTVENRPAILVFFPRESSPRPDYFILLDWDENGQVARIKDTRYVRYVIQDAEISIL